MSYPLNWPVGWPRTPEYKRQPGAFQVSLLSAVEHLYKELELLGAIDIDITSSVPFGRNGRPLSKTGRPDDPGVALYFTLNGKQQCIPCDRWNNITANVRAIGLTIQALRGLDRWGAKEMVDAAFSGFAALPA